MTTDKKAIIIFGIGALGGNIAESIARQNIVNSLDVVDKDIVEGRNIPTQPYTQVDIGKMKAKVLVEKLYRISKIGGIAISEELTESNLNVFKKKINDSVRDFSLIIDCFDNPSSRKMVQKLARDIHKNCIHIGMMESYGEVVWDENYKVPEIVGTNPCDNSNSRELVLIITSLATKTIREFFDKGLKNNFSITMEDLKIDKWKT